MKMKGSKDVLSSIIKTTQMGQVGIRSVTEMPLRADLRQELQTELKEYDAIERDAQALAASRGWELEQLAPMAKSMARMTTKAKLSYGDVNSKVAAMMIQGNTRGMIKGLKNLHQLKNADQRVMDVSQRLLDCEKANIQNMQGFV